MRRAAVGIVLGTMILLGAVACGAPSTPAAKTESGADTAFEEVKIKLSDGRTVLCLTGMYRLNCDWEGAR